MTMVELFNHTFALFFQEKLMKLVSIVLLGFSLSAFAKPQICTFDYVKEGSALLWTAFKTPKKVGVIAKFSDFTINAKNSKSIEDLLSSATFEVNAQSVDSGDKLRDAKIMQFFFKKMASGQKITGKVLKVKDKTAEVEMTLNGTKKVVPMTFTFDEKAKKLNLKGSIDVLEFGMKESLASITKACFEKHEGVTWPNVDLDLTANIKQDCKQ